MSTGNFVPCEICGKDMWGHLEQHRCAKCGKRICGFCIKKKEGGVLGIGAKEYCPQCAK